MYSRKEIDTSNFPCELIASELELSRSESLIVVSVYRAPNTNLRYLELMCYCLNDSADKNPNAVIWFAGGVNLPNINWSNCSISGNNYPSSYCNIILDMFCNAQLADFPIYKK